MSILTQAHREQGRLGETEVTGIGVKAGDEDRGDEK